MQPLHSWGPPTRGAKLEVATSPLPSREPSTERNCYVSLAFSEICNKGAKIRSGYFTPCLLRGPQEGTMAT